MPAVYIALHLALCFLLWKLARRVAARGRVAGALAGAAIGLMLLGFVLERNPVLAWNSMQLPGDGWVFLINLSLETVTVLAALLWGAAKSVGEKRRTVFMTLPLLGVSLWSYAWYFMPVPPGLNGKVDRRGYCGQTSDDSCSAAAATMLLHRHGIKATEAEMAELCLTRAGFGTPPLGLYRGLWIKAHDKGLRPRLVMVRHPAELARLGGACIIAVGLRPGTPEDKARKLIEYGWQPGLRHAVAVLKADPQGKWMDVADPTLGLERWPTGDLEYIWDGQALVLTPR